MGNLTEEEREVYAKKNLKLVYHFVNKYRNSFNDEHELISEGMLGLTNALKYFDKSKGIKFSTYASTCIIRTIKIYQAEQAKKDSNLRYDLFPANEDGESLPGKEAVSEEDTENESVLRLLIEDVLTKHSERNAEVIRLYLDGKPYSEIGEIHGISKIRVGQIVNGLLEKIRREYKIGESEKAVL